MKLLDFIKNLIIGFWQNGFISLCKIVLEQWLVSLLVVILITYLCSDSETAKYAWILIGIFAIYCAIKAVIEIFIEIRNYLNANNIDDKTLIIKKMGGKIFELLLCVVGIFQAMRTLSHVSKVTKSASSAVNVVDDVASAISKFLEELKR